MVPYGVAGHLNGGDYTKNVTSSPAMTARADTTLLRTPRPIPCHWPVHAGSYPRRQMPIRRAR